MTTQTQHMWDAQQGPKGPRLGGLGNVLKTGLLLAALSALALVVGQQLGGTRGLLIAGVFMLAMNFGSYWFSDTP